MKNILVLLFLGITLCACQKPHSKFDYIPLVEELYSIECGQVKDSGINFVINDTNIYTFRGLAFDRIMTKKINPLLIAHYEELYQKLAAMEYNMDESEKISYREDIKEIYKRNCR